MMRNRLERRKISRASVELPLDDLTSTSFGRNDETYRFAFLNLLPSEDSLTAGVRLKFQAHVLRRVPRDPDLPWYPGPAVHPLFDLGEVPCCGFYGGRVVSELALRDLARLEEILKALRTIQDAARAPGIAEVECELARHVLALRSLGTPCEVRVLLNRQAVDAATLPKGLSAEVQASISMRRATAAA